jgi:hypothetical protein
MLIGTKYKEGTVVLFSDNVPQLSGVIGSVVDQDFTYERTTVELSDGEVVETFTESLSPVKLH